MLGKDGLILKNISGDDQTNELAEISKLSVRGDKYCFMESEGKQKTFLDESANLKVEMDHCGVLSGLLPRATS